MTVPFTGGDLTVLDFPTWTPIARVSPTKSPKRWRPVDNAPLTLREAKVLAAQGSLLMAQQAIGGIWHVVVHNRRQGRHEASSL